MTLLDDIKITLLEKTRKDLYCVECIEDARKKKGEKMNRGCPSNRLMWG